MAIIRGRPSGTAITMIITARISASSRSVIMPAAPVAKYAPKLPARTILWIRSATAMAMPPIYPNLEMPFARSPNFTLRGDSLSSSC